MINCQRFFAFLLASFLFASCKLPIPENPLLTAIQNGPAFNYELKSTSSLPMGVVALSCSAKDVQAALNLAQTGEMVLIPPGECDWGTSVVTGVAGIWLRGSGKGVTTIKRSAPVTSTGAEFLLQFDCANGKLLEISDLSFVGNDENQTEAQRLVDQDNGLGLKNGCKDFKIHDATFSKFSNAGLTISGGGRGVIYNNEFISNFKCQATPVSCLGYGVAVYGNGAWDPTPLSSQLGSADFVFIEWNYFEDNRHAVASNNGSKYVVRYNQIATTQRARNFGPIDAHGKGSSPRGSRLWEIYENTLIDLSTTKNNTTSISLRGGDGVIYNNRIPTSFAWVFALSTETSCDQTNYPIPDQTREAYAWGNEFSAPTIPLKISNSPDCLKVDRELKNQKPSWYMAYPYPHPLRISPL